MRQSQPTLAGSPPRHAPRRLPVALALGLVAFTGCGGEPSFTVSWGIAQDLAQIDDATEPSSPAECTARGIDGVRIVTRQGGLLIDERRFDCFEGGAVAGPELPNGSYDVEVLGLRRSQEAWACEVSTTYVGDPTCTGAQGCACSDDGRCDEHLSCASQFNEARTEVLARFCEACTARAAFELEIDGSVPQIEAALIAPPQCDDGIDNDADGLTDILDPACASDPQANEGDDFIDTIFDIEVTFLNGNKLAECKPGATNAFPLGVPLIVLDVKRDGELVERIEQVCRRNLPIERRELDDGDYTLEVTGYARDQDGKASTPLTATESFDFQVAGAGTFVTAQVDFAGDEFLDPITGAVGARFSYDIVPNDGSSAGARGCASDPASSNQRSQIVVDEIDITVFDVAGDPVDPSTLGFMNATFIGDAARFACTNMPIQTASLDWGSFAIDVQGRVQGEVCFDTQGPVDVLPDLIDSFVVPRVTVDGQPPMGCEDCMSDADCIDTDAPRCVMGLCEPAL